MLKPDIEDHEMDAEVAAFERSILFYADAFHKFGHGARSVKRMPSSAAVPALIESSLSVLPSRQPSMAALTPAIIESSCDSSAPVSVASSRQPSSMANAGLARPSLVSRLSDMLLATARELEEKASCDLIQDDRRCSEESKIPQDNAPQAWELEAATVNRSVKILPGVRRMLSSIPKGRYAVATSGAKTYAYGCMTRVGINPPEVTITADDVAEGKPAPDPFLLAAKCLGFSAADCVVFEDSPSGIRAGVASGATVIAVCTSHERAQIENCGAHHIVEDMMSKVECKVIGQGKDMKLQFTVLDDE